MKTQNAAAAILADMLTMPADKSIPACMYFNVALGTRSAAFRLLSKKGLIEVDFVAYVGNKNWKVSELGRSVRSGEELSAVL